MSRLLLIDGNSIMNRAFYGIMGSKMLTTPDGRYTNAVYGFLAILFKVLEDLNPEYIGVAFDRKAPTARHKMYEGYKANRHGMPEELAQQMPMIKEILQEMNISIMEKDGYEADDILGTLAKRGEKEGLEVTILSGDRDTFQLASDKITIRIPHTKMGKTEEDDFDREKVLETYGVEPVSMIEVKGLMGDSSDNIPGVPGIGEKTALSLIKDFGSIDAIYQKLEEDPNCIKGKLKEKLLENKDLAYLSRTLGTINLEVPIEESMQDFARKEWNKEEVGKTFQELRFNRFIERFDLKQEKSEETKKEKAFQTKELKTDEEIAKLQQKIQHKKEMTYFFSKENDLNQETAIIKKHVTAIHIYQAEEDMVYQIHLKKEEDLINWKEILEDPTILKNGYQMTEDYVFLKEREITMQGISYDLEIAAYDLNPSVGKYKVSDLAFEYLGIDMENDSSNDKGKDETQMNLFSEMEGSNEKEELDPKDAFTVYVIGDLKPIMLQKLEQDHALSLFQEIEMPLVTVLGEMQFNGMKVDREELNQFGAELKDRIRVLTQEIYELSGEEFNINSTLQLGKILFEKLKLPVYKKNKKGYSTDVDVLEKLKKEHPIIQKILEYRTIVKLNSTYVEGLMPFINPKTGRIHSFFHQTITATGRISSTDPNLQNIPTREELGKNIRKAFKPQEGYVYIDADYSQIELRVLAHISGDENMINAFVHHEDIHKQAASKVLGIPIEEVTKEQRSSAKAVNFGIVYGISDYGLSEQLGIPVKEAKQYIQQYLEKYAGIKQFMDDIVEKAKEQGYVETMFHRRRYIPELKSNHYMVRQFGSRAAMNTPIQGTAADIMKLAMIHVYQELKEKNLDAKLVRQVHDELIIECQESCKEAVKEILKNNMENVILLKVPLEADLSEATSWYDTK